MCIRDSSTGILENLALNIPTMCFWYDGLDHIHSKARPYYELLRDVGILADTPEQAAKNVALHWNEIEEWWGNEKVQNARRLFCEQYARVEKQPVRILKRLLTKAVLNHSDQAKSQHSPRCKLGVTVLPGVAKVATVGVDNKSGQLCAAWLCSAHFHFWHTSAQPGSS